MSQEDVVHAEHTRLREAAIEVLDTMPDVRNPSARIDAALRDLHAALRGDAPSRSGTERPALDPFEHSLAARRYVGRQGEPIPLLQRAADLRRRLEGDRALDHRLPGEPSRNVVITELRAMVVAGLLEELAARLSAGAAFGPGRAGEELARLATDLAGELLDQTFVSPQQ
jgi:hypothetical protein